MQYNRFNPIKTLVYSDRIFKIVNGHMPYPVIWHIYPTWKCCNDCTFCIMKNGRSRQTSLDANSLFRAVADAAKSNAKTVHFTGGGEPLMHPATSKAITIAASKGLKVALSTNGYLLTPDVARYVDYLRISLNAGTKKTHERISNAKTWEAVISNIKGLSAMKRKLSGLGFVVIPENCDEVYDFCVLARELGMGFVHIRPAHWPERDSEIQCVCDRVGKQVASASVNIGPTLDIFFVTSKFDGYWTKRCYNKCRATPLIAVLTPDAKFILCQDRLDLEFGDYSKSSFEDIWFSKKHRDVIDSIDIDTCPRCVESRKNEFIQRIFLNDELLMYML